MKIFNLFSKPIATVLLTVFIFSLVLFVGTVVMLPTPAKATYPTITLGNVYDALKEIAKGIAMMIATRFINQFLTRFIDKIVEKFKVRNFLYYDQILSNYYFTNLIRDKINDPDLEQIYLLLNQAYVTGGGGGAVAGEPDPALIPQIRQAIYDRYVESGGIETSVVEEPVDQDAVTYYESAQNYYFNHPSYTERNLSGQFGQYQSNATTASQLEVLVGKGLKAGRVFGGTCEINGGIPNGSNTNSAAGCAAAGGVWNASALDQARSFIDNPSEMINNYMENAVETMFNININNDKPSIWFQIGSLMGNFIFNKLLLNNAAGQPLNEDPRIYAPEVRPIGGGVPVDIDGDGVIDGYDTTGDGAPDTCLFAGPPCQGSRAATTDPGPPPVDPVPVEIQNWPPELTDGD